LPRGHPKRVRASTEFRAQVADYNKERAQKGRPGKPLAPLNVDLPDYTTEQLERDTIRGYNGYAAGLHEYRVKVDADGLLAVSVDSSGTRGTAEWEVISAQERVAEYDRRNIPTNLRGDPSYVDAVFAQAGF
jgi:hypothetical protein